MTDLHQQQEQAMERFRAARGDKDYEYSIEVLDEILDADPQAIDPMITQAHLRGLKGDIALAEYRDTVAQLLPRVNGNNVQSLEVWRKLLRGVQYTFAGQERTARIRQLLETSRDAIAARHANWQAAALFEADLQLALADYETFAAVVDSLSEADHELKQLRPLRKIAKKVKRPNFPSRRAEKVFGIGLSRTATSSLNRALRMLGYHSIHWLNPHTQTVITEEDYPLFDAFSDISVSYQFEALYDQYSNARFIYTTRPRDAWIESVTAHYLNSSGIGHPGELEKPDMKERFHGTVYPVEHNLYARHADWASAFDDFERRIQARFRQGKDPRFLELRVTEGQGWETLCPFLEKQVPDKPFPNVNKRPKKFADQPGGA